MAYLPLLRQLFPEQVQPEWLKRRFPEEEVRLTLLLYRCGALFYYIEAAALRIEGRKKQQRIRRQLQIIGGRLARFKDRPGHETVKKALLDEIQLLREELRNVPHWPRLIDPQLWWHWAMVLAHECLPRSSSKGKVSAEDVSNLCAWLSVPEIGLRCSLATIKGARRRFATRAWFGKQLPTYLATQRSSRLSSSQKKEESDLSAAFGVPKSIQYTCYRCRATEEGHLLDLGTHLREQHHLESDAVEIVSEQNEIRIKETKQVVAIWTEAF